MAIAARNIGTSLLQEVEEGSLDTLLCDLRTASAPSDPSISSVFGLLPVDKLTHASTSDSDPSNKKTPVIEVTSAHPDAESTNFLYHAVARAILPADSGGRGGAAILIDCQDQLDIFRLAEIIRKSLYQDCEPVTMMPAECIEARVVHTLKHLHVLRPSSLGSLITSITSLKAYLLDPTCHQSSSRQLELLAIADLTSFFWEERAAQEEAKYDTSSQDERDGPRPDGFVTLTRALRSIVRSFSCSVVATTYGLSLTPPSRPSLRPYLRQLLPTAWTDFLTSRLAIQKEPIKRFPDGYGVKEAEADRERRDQVLDEGRIGVWVLEGGGGEGREHVIKFDEKGVTV